MRSILLVREKEKSKREVVLMKCGVHIISKKVVVKNFFFSNILIFHGQPKMTNVHYFFVDGENII